LEAEKSANALAVYRLVVMSTAVCAFFLCVYLLNNTPNPPATRPDSPQLIR
jgi:hypothetical protein